MIDIKHRVTSAVLLTVNEPNLRGANLYGANLYGANLSDADLRCADLYGANLSGADLRCADLRCADLSDADLRYADLRDADLRDANLRYADLRYANLRYANLSGAKGLPLPANHDAKALRAAVASHIEAHPELHDQGSWGSGSDDPACGTPCCVAGWACHLGGGEQGLGVATAATLLLHVDGMLMPSFDADTSREEILAALKGE